MRHLAAEHSEGAVQREESIVLEQPERRHTDRNRKPADHRQPAQEKRIGASAGRRRGHSGHVLQSTSARTNICFASGLMGEAR